MKMDLHMHSDFSLDGEFSPEELAVRCAKSGIDCAALTDHNCVRGTARFRKAADALGIRTFSGVELDCVAGDVDLHLLGYGIDETDSRYAAVEENILAQKRSGSQTRMEIIRNMGILVDDDSVMRLAKGGIVVGEMIAEAALADERNRDNVLLAPYRPGGSRSDNPFVNFFWDFCAQGKPAYLTVSYMSFEEALALIRNTGGAAVIAHPANTVGRREELIAGMASCGLAGIEVFSSYHSPEDVAYYRELAGRLSLAMTGGSDYHGKTKPAVRPGDTNGMSSLDREAALRLLKQCAPE